MSTPSPHAPTFPLEGAQSRYLDWLEKLKRQDLLPVEMLLPQLQLPCPNVLPALMRAGNRVPGVDPAELQAKVDALKPWGYGIQLAKGVRTESNNVAVNRMKYRSHLITGAVRHLLGSQISECSFLDLACNHGYFTIEMAHSGARSALGVDLRPENIAKAELLNSHFGQRKASFRTQDIYTLDTSEPFDVVLNLGVLYHITDPYRLVELSYALCKRFAVIDSIMHKEPVSAYIQRLNKDATRHAEGKFEVELHPTYRAVIDLMHAVGFQQVIEVVCAKEDPAVGSNGRHDLYDRHDRRCLIGFKTPVELSGLVWPDAQQPAQGEAASPAAVLETERPDGAAQQTASPQPPSEPQDTERPRNPWPGFLRVFKSKKP